MIRQPHATLLSGSISQRSTPLLLSVIAIAVFAIAQRAQAQNYQVIYNFTGLEGSTTSAALTIDANGNLYGASLVGGNFGGDCTDDPGCGTIFKLSSNGSGWVFSQLYAFTGGTDGALPTSSLIPGPGNAFYGTTLNGGLYANNGTVFAIKPSAKICGPAPCWTHTVIHDFDGSDGSGPTGNVTFDQAGNLYGTTVSAPGHGMVYKLAPSGRTWTLGTLYHFPGRPVDGAYPYAGVIMDSAGNFYGVTRGGGAHGWGTVFELVPSGSAWEEITLHDFAGGDDGSDPLGALIFDHSGNLVGTTTAGGAQGGGSVFELTRSGDSWTFSTLYSFSGYGGPQDRLVIDTAGNLYGTTYQSGPNTLGTVSS